MNWRRPFGSIYAMRRILLFAGVLAMGAPVALAHHSFAVDYHEDQSVTLEGDLQEFQYRNPHAMVLFRVQENGEEVSYAAEWAGAGRLGQQGITPETLKLGDHVIITGAPGRDAAAHRVHLKAIERPADGWSWGGRNGFGRAGGRGRFGGRR